MTACSQATPMTSALQQFFESLYPYFRWGHQHAEGEDEDASGKEVISVWELLPSFQEIQFSEVNQQKYQVSFQLQLTCQKASQVNHKCQISTQGVNFILRSQITRECSIKINTHTDYQQRYSSHISIGKASYQYHKTNSHCNCYIQSETGYSQSLICMKPSKNSIRKEHLCK